MSKLRLPDCEASLFVLCSLGLPYVTEGINLLYNWVQGEAAHVQVLTTIHVHIHCYDFYWQLSTDCFNFNVAQRDRVDDNIRDTEKVSPGNSPQVLGGGVKQSLTQLELLHGQVQIVPIGKLVLCRGNARTLLNPVRVWCVWYGIDLITCHKIQFKSSWYFTM